MKKLFVIPGFTHTVQHKMYRWIQEDLGSRFEIVMVPINWKYQVMSDYIDQFLDVYKKQSGSKNYVLGFSFGAMIALLSSKSAKPDQLLLCSLSPYFREDLPVMKEGWKRFIGKRRMADFQLHSAKNAAKNVSIPTQMFVGEVEAEKFPSLQRRCKQTAKDVRSTLIVVPNAPHDISHPNYKEEIKKALQT